MRKIIFSLFIIFSSFAVFQLHAQDRMEDVIYLKDGSIYRGMIIEEIPNENYKIRIMGGSEIVVSIDEIEKISKEKKQVSPKSGYHHRMPMGGGFPPYHGWHHRSDSSENYYVDRGKFILIQILLDNKQGGVHFIHGFKFNKNVGVGIGVGIDRLFNAPFNEKINDLKKRALSGYYVPVFVHVTGDMHDSRVTPFYVFEAGFTAGKLDKDRKANDDFKKDKVYGAYGTAGLGVKISGPRGRNFSILAHVNVKNLNYKEKVTTFDASGNAVKDIKDRNATIITPGIRFGLGLTKAGGMKRGK